MARPIKKVFIADRDSDGCTIISKPYKWLTGKYLEQRHCCITHDMWYHFGGTSEQRLTADENLKDCVHACGDTKFEKKCFLVVGWIMYCAVRVGGSPKLPFPWRWRNNVGYELEDVLSGYKNTPIDYDEECLMESKLLDDIIEKCPDGSCEYNGDFMVEPKLVENIIQKYKEDTNI